MFDPDPGQNAKLWSAMPGLFWRFPCKQEKPGAKTLLRISRVPEYVGAQLGFALPWWFWLMLVAGWLVAYLTITSALPNSTGRPPVSLRVMMPSLYISMAQAMVVPMVMVSMPISLHT